MTTASRERNKTAWSQLRQSIFTCEHFAARQAVSRFPGRNSWGGLACPYSELLEAILDALCLGPEMCIAPKALGALLLEAEELRSHPVT